MKNEAADLRPCEGTEHPKFGKKFLKLYNAIIQFKEYDQFIINNCVWAHVIYKKLKK